MSRVYHSANPQHTFRSRKEIEEHLLSKLSNTGGKTGTELELFVTTPEGLPITFDQVEMVLEHFASQFKGAKTATEKGRIVALDIPGVGDVSLEPGGQVELSTKPCDSLEELEMANRTLRRALENTAAFFDLCVKGQGHMPSFLKAEDGPRSRFAAYREYLSETHGAEKAEALIDTMKSCCGLQVNVDPMGEDFHEIYRALMLVDVANSLSQRTTRQERLFTTYAKLVPEQHTPVFEALAARSNEEAMAHVVDRLLSLKVPFMPDSSAEGFRSTASVFGVTPTVGELLEKGALTTEILDNALTLQLTMPNLRRHGVVETRAPDSPDTVEELMQTARAYHAFAYDAKARRALLDAFADIDPLKLKDAFLRRFEIANVQDVDIGGGKKVSDLVAVVSGEQQQVRIAARSRLQPRSGKGRTAGL